MTFVSHAQNFEDVMLWRALKNIKDGFYIDIGAQDPVIDSVSLAFYEHGWRGVHIDPSLEYSEKLKLARVDEVVRRAIVSNDAGFACFYEFPGTGLSTADQEIAARHLKAGFSFSQQEVPLIKLESILDEYENRAIHWLKIDVEGFERNVIEGWGNSKVRPWVLIVESTRPLTEEPSYSEWEELLISKGYLFAYFDGLNRFYLHQNHADLLIAFQVPPNVFDGFILGGNASSSFGHKIVTATSEIKSLNEKIQEGQREGDLLRREVEDARKEVDQASLREDSLSSDLASSIESLEVLKGEIASAKECAARLCHELRHADQKVSEFDGRLTAIESSLSWHLTAPVRLAGGILLRIIEMAQSVPERLHRFVLNGIPNLLVYSMKAVLDDPKLSYRVNRWIMRIPSLHRKLVSIARSRDLLGYGTTSISDTKTQSSPNPPNELSDLTIRARQIYIEIKKALDTKRGAQ